MSNAERLNVIILHVSDLEKSLQFYRDSIGTPLEPGFKHARGGSLVRRTSRRALVAELSWRDGAYLHFALFPVRPTHRVTSGVELAFAVDDAVQTHERLTGRGATALHEPRAEPWGWCARYLDPDGNIVGLTSRARSPDSPISTPRSSTGSVPVRREAHARVGAGPAVCVSAGSSARVAYIRRV